MVTLLIVILGLVGCTQENQQEEVTIGFVGGLTGKYSSLGHDVLNGVHLALNEVQSQVNGKRIVLLEKDDKQNASSAREAIDYFKEKKVELIIGNTTSSMTKVSLDALASQKDIILFSPTASSNEFSNKDDNFLRTQVAHSTKRFDVLSQHLVEKEIRKLYTIHDPKNSSYSNNYLVNFKKSYLQHGGDSFINSMTIERDFHDILSDIKTSNMDAIVIVANSLDTAKLIQFLRLNGIKNKIISSGWAMTKDLLENGGKSVEGVLFATGYNDNAQNPDYLNFVAKYSSKYGEKPSVFSAQAYETIRVVLETLSQESDVKKVKSTILKKRIFDGLQGKIIFNQYGDVDRDYFLMEIKDNRFQRL